MRALRVNSVPQTSPPVIDMEYRIDGGASVSLGSAEPDDYPIDVQPGQQVRFRFVNIVGGRWSAPVVAPEAPQRWAYSPTVDQQGVRFYRSRDFLQNIYSTGWAFFIEAEFPTGTTNICWADGNGGFNFQLRTDFVRVSNWGTNFDSAAFYNGGRLGIVVSYDGTTLRVWVKEDDGSIVKIIEQATTFAATRTNLYGFQLYNFETAFGTFPGTVLPQKITATALWANGDSLSEAQAADLLNGVALPADLTPAPFVDMSFEGGRCFDQAGNVTAVRTAGAKFDMTLSSAGILPYVLRHPETSQPVQQDFGDGLRYVAALYDAPNGVQFLQSTDLETWTTLGSVVTFSALGNAIVNEFMWAGHIAGDHDPFMLWLLKSGAAGDGAAGIHLYTSDDLVNWTADAANPVFNRTTLGTQAEDFRVINLGASNWAAYYEHDNYQTDGALAVGAAQNTNAVPTGAFTNVTDNILGTGDAITGSDPFFANPGVARMGDQVYLFYEVVKLAGLSSGGFGPTEFLRVASVEDALTSGTFEKRDCIMARAAGEVQTLFANPAIVIDGSIYRGALTKDGQVSPHTVYGWVKIDLDVFEQVPA